MQKTILTFLFIILNITIAYADPFYDEEDINEEVKKNEEIILKNEKSHLNCNKEDNLETINIVEKFQELKLIGIISIDDNFTGLLLNDALRIIELKKDQMIEPSKIQIIDINSKEIEYIDWGKSNNCKTPIKIKLAI
ncbi:hypothetical protein [Otariodibacter oris]|uniref:Pilus assembly protein PilP n=1 Tax=Otariodibacter oris TaxID=1032623 RepID=A0A420XJK2_9PAST|nr:hypothetical protein [Otariodibacter oris]QGM80422.1 hypothetical protein A6A10_02925 [Otariodibacter oris]RKR77433.1 hypothetical protein DES31_0763 [Otariodibacter oris]